MCVKAGIVFLDRHQLLHKVVCDIHIGDALRKIYQMVSTYIPFGITKRLSTKDSKHRQKNYNQLKERYI